MHGPLLRARTGPRRGAHTELRPRRRGEASCRVGLTRLETGVSACSSPWRRRWRSCSAVRPPAGRAARRGPPRRARCSASPATSRASRPRPARSRSSTRRSSAGARARPTARRSPALLPTLGPIPMLHLGTRRQGGEPRRSPRGDIAAGQGRRVPGRAEPRDRGLGQGDLRPPDGRDEQLQRVLLGVQRRAGRRATPTHSTASYRAGVPAHLRDPARRHEEQIDAKLARLGLPPVQRRRPVLEPVPAAARRLEPARHLAAAGRRATRPTQYYPGDAYVDVVGGDIYDENFGDRPVGRPRGARTRPAVARTKPFSVPEWGLTGVDDPAFINRMCDVPRLAPRDRAVRLLREQAGVALRPRGEAAEPPGVRRLHRPARGRRCPTGRAGGGASAGR